MSDDKKMPELGVLIGRLKAKSNSRDEKFDYDDEKSEDQSGGEEDNQVSAMLDAVKSDDVEGFKSSLQAFLEICYPQLSGE